MDTPDNKLSAKLQPLFLIRAALEALGIAENIDLPKKARPRETP